MSDKPQRPFWQVHLSTAVLLMIVTAAVLYLNTVPAEAALAAQKIPGPEDLRNSLWLPLNSESHAINQIVAPLWGERLVDFTTTPEEPGEMMELESLSLTSFTDTTRAATYFRALPLLPLVALYVSENVLA